MLTESGDDHLKEDHDDAGGDRDIRDVEGCPSEATDAEIDEVHDVAEVQAIGEVAQGACQDQGEGEESVRLEL